MRTLRLHLEVAHAGSHDRLMAHKLSSLVGRDRILHSSFTYAALTGVKGSEFRVHTLLKSLCVLEYSNSVFKIKNYVFLTPTSFFDCLL